MVDPVRPAEVGEYLAVNLTKWSDEGDERWRIVPITEVDDRGLVRKVLIDGEERPLNAVTDSQWFLFIRDTFADGGAAFEAAKEKDWDSDDVLRAHLMPHIRADYKTWVDDAANARRASFREQRLAKDVSAT